MIKTKNKLHGTNLEGTTLLLYYDTLLLYCDTLLLYCATLLLYCDTLLLYSGFSFRGRDGEGHHTEEVVPPSFKYSLPLPEKCSAVKMFILWAIWPLTGGPCLKQSSDGKGSSFSPFPSIRKTCKK